MKYSSSCALNTILGSKNIEVTLKPGSGGSSPTALCLPLHQCNHARARVTYFVYTLAS